MTTGGPQYRVARRTESAPVDGNPHKSVWRSVHSLTLTHHMGAPPAHRPTVRAKIAWDPDALYLLFEVEDRFVRAVARHCQDPVCRDSCVEFFFTPGEELGHAYFNLEINCGGTILFWWHPETGAARPVDAGDCMGLSVASTLPKMVNPELAIPVNWAVECRLPMEVVKRYCSRALAPAMGTCWRANLYKCGDRTSHPHWLTWSDVNFPTPRFHMPAFFGKLRFA